MVDDMTEPELKTGGAGSDGKSKRSVVTTSDEIILTKRWHELHDLTTNTLNNDINDNLITIVINDNEGSADLSMHVSGGSGAGDFSSSDPLVIDDNSEQLNKIDIPLALELVNSHLKFNSDSNSVNNIIDFVIGVDDDNSLFMYNPSSKTSTQQTAQPTLSHTSVSTQQSINDNLIYEKLVEMNEKINSLVASNIDLNNEIKSCDKYSVISIETLADDNTVGHKSKSCALIAELILSKG